MSLTFRRRPSQALAAASAVLLLATLALWARSYGASDQWYRSRWTSTARPDGAVPVHETAVWLISGGGWRSRSPPGRRLARRAGGRRLRLSRRDLLEAAAPGVPTARPDVVWSGLGFGYWVSQYGWGYRASSRRLWFPDRRGPCPGRVAGGLALSALRRAHRASRLRGPAPLRYDLPRRRTLSRVWYDPRRDRAATTLTPHRPRGRGAAVPRSGQRSGVGGGRIRDGRKVLGGTDAVLATPQLRKNAPR